MLRWWPIVLVAGCYHPQDYAPCAIRCDPQQPAATCPAEQICGTNGMCKAIGAADCLPADGGIEDAPTDAPPSATTLCLGTFFRACVEMTGLAPLTYDTNRTIDTRNMANCTFVQPAMQSGAPSVCVIAGSSVTVAANITVRFEGNRPVALFSATTMLIAGTIDVSSFHRSSTGIGAGADTGPCAPTDDGGAGVGTNGGGGGAGATLAAQGGNGGDGEVEINHGIAMPSNMALLVLRGGCPGGHGGASAVGETPGPGGSSGGAVYLMAKTSLTLTSSAVINASGMGGRVAMPHAGGGGGGSGGVIGFSAASYPIDPAAQIFAVGGGGSSGGGGMFMGMDGLEATSPNDTQPTNGVETSGSGGGGSANGGGGGGNGTNNCGGGGGGGGGGIIGFEGVVPSTNGVSVRPTPRQF